MRWYRFAGVRIITGILMLAVVGGFLLSGKMRLTEHVIQPTETEKPDMRVQNVHLIEQAEVGNEWELWAHEAEFYDAKHLVVLRQLRAKLLLKADQQVYVMAEYGQIDNATGNMTIQGHVQLQYLEGYIIETDVLHWQATSRVLRTDAAVKIDSALVHIAGIGLLGHVDEQRFVLQDNVHAAFKMQ
jgi:LPS export ABC transporter protein LptC